MSKVTLKEMSKLFLVASAVTSVPVYVEPLIVGKELVYIKEESPPNIRVSENKQILQNSSTYIINSVKVAYTDLDKKAPEVQIINKEVAELEIDKGDYREILEELPSDYYPTVKISKLNNFEIEMSQSKHLSKRYAYNFEDVVTTYDVKTVKPNKTVFRF